MIDKANKAGNSRAGYHRFVNEDGEEYGSFEVWWLDRSAMENPVDIDELSQGWYWSPGFPGCTHDGPPNGPFHTSTEAWRDARG